MISFTTSAKYDKDATIILLTEEQIKSKDFSSINKNLKTTVSMLVCSEQFYGKTGEVLPLFLKNRITMLVGLGDIKSFSLTSLRIVVKSALESSYLKKIKEIEIIPSTKEESYIIALIEGIMIGTYSWTKYKTKTKKDAAVSSKKYSIAVERSKTLDKAIKICNGVNLTRDLVNDNADTITSDHIEKTIVELVKGKKSISLDVLNKKELTEKGLNLHLAVNQGSNKEPKLIIIKYTASDTEDGYTAIIGKGITFDSGGLNLKPTGHIETMREDMSGAAAVVGVLKNVISLNLKKNIIFACAIAENAIGLGSYKPGDVFKSYSGKTVEIGNTDAEGRLVLADAIAYVEKNYKPECIIDIATLTGACVVALGYDYTGLISTNDALAEKLLSSAKATDDRAWKLPIYPEISDALKSQIADIKNIGLSKGAAGTITAGEFLRTFTGNLNWAHLDIAGTAFVENHKRMYFSHGATGASVRLLTNFLKNN